MVYDGNIFNNKVEIMRSYEVFDSYFILSIVLF